MGTRILFSLVVISFVNVVFCQKSNTTSSTIAEDLRDCYNETAIPGILDPKQRAPATFNYFLDLLRALEDTNTGIKDGYYLSSDIIKKFRQDGIVYQSVSVGLPFTATFNHKNTLLQKKTLINTESNLLIDGITKKEQCVLHYFISTNNNLTVRGDESSTCRTSSRYTSRFRKRQVEQFSSTFNSETSTCPVELGVVENKWGSISIGSVLSGIAAGFKPEDVPNYGNSLFINTIAGDIAYALLYNLNDLNAIGTVEGWDNSLSPKLLYNNARTSKLNEVYLTNAKIRGALDGFYLGKQLQEWRNKYSDIKISQILDLYYSPRGVFNNTIRACNRNILETTYISTDILKNQTAVFVKKLNGKVGATSVTDEEIEKLVTQYVDQVNKYITQLSDVKCNPDSELPVQRTAADVIIFIDSKWKYETVESIVAYILNNIDVNKYESNFTLVNANNDQVIVNSTHRLGHLYVYYNSTQNQTNGAFDYIKMMHRAEELLKNKFDNKISGGKSSVIILLPTTAPTENEKTFINQRKQILTEFLPNIQLLVMGQGTEADYGSILTNPSKQFVQVPDYDGSNFETLKTATKKIIDIISNSPREIINTNCATSTSASTFSAPVYNVESQGISYYRLSPYFFYHGGSSKAIKIRELGSGKLYVCNSRTNEKPSNSSDTCVILANNDTSYSLNDYCGDTFDSCSSLYLSIEGRQSNSMCSDCRFPDSVKFQISLEDVGCGSSAVKIMANFLIVAVLVLALKL